MRMFLKITFCLLTAMMLAGCLNTANTVGNAETNMNPTPIAMNKLVTDRALARRLVVQRLDGAMNDNGLMMMQLEAVNARTGFWAGLWSAIWGEVPYEVDYKVVWLDDRGMSVDSLMNTWRRVQVQPGEVLYIKSVAPNPQCRDFRVSLKAVD